MQSFLAANGITIVNGHILPFSPSNNLHSLVAVGSAQKNNKELN
jgi:hypothetical protein